MNNFLRNRTSGVLIRLSVLALILFQFAVLSCAKAMTDSDLEIDRGLVSEVSALSLTTVNWFEIEAEAGTVTRFRAEGSLGEFTPSHLRQHMIAGEPVLVSFVIRQGEKIAIEVEDSSLP